MLRFRIRTMDFFGECAPRTTYDIDTWINDIYFMDSQSVVLDNGWRLDFGVWCHADSDEGTHCWYLYEPDGEGAWHYRYHAYEKGIYQWTN
jgi:hypothetical protein